MSVRVTWRSWLLGLGLLASTLSAQVQANVDERALKAAYLYNFIQFTQWPEPPEHRLTLCVVGSTALDGYLDRLAGKPVLNGAQIDIRRVAPREVASACQVLYLDDNQRDLTDDLLLRLGSAPVLTITDADGLADRGVMIEIHRRDERLGFEVNLRSARRAKLQFSARLLKLASYVAGAP